MSTDTVIDRHNVTPYLLINNASRCIGFLKIVFNAEIIYGPEYREDGSFMHSEIKIGDSTIMIGEPPQNEKKLPSCIYITVSDSKVVYEKAVNEGGKPLCEPGQEGSPYYGGIEDSWGNQWWIANI